MNKSIIVLLLASTAAYAATEEHLTKTFPVTTGGTLIVDVDFGAIEVDTNAAPAEISVDAWRKVTRKTKSDEERFLRDHPVQFDNDGKTLKILCRSKEKNLFSGKNRNEGKYLIHVPAQFNTRLNTAGGEVSVSGLTGETRVNTSGGRLGFAHLHGPLTGVTSGGDVHLADCDGTAKVGTSGGKIEATACAGSLDATTSGGPISVQTFQGPAVLETSGGSISLSKIGGRLQASTSGGSIGLVMIAPVPGEISLSSSGGNLNLEAPENAAFNIDARTSGGEVACDLPVTVKGKLESERLNGTVNGGGPEVVLRTDGGDIRIRKSDAPKVEKP